MNKNHKFVLPDRSWSTESTEEEFPITEEDWKLDDAYFRDLYEKSLTELIQEGYLEGEVDRIGVRTLPVGLLSWWRELVDRESKLSLSKLQRISINHGLSIAAHDRRIKEVVVLYREKRKLARDTGDKQLVKILEEKGGSLNFSFEAKYSTSIGIVKRAEGPLAAFSAALGVPITKLILYLSTLSMMTLPESGWKRMLREEVNLFWKYIEQRAKTLR